LRKSTIKNGRVGTDTPSLRIKSKWSVEQELLEDAKSFYRGV
jgi:hypothetical protein